AYLQDPTLDYPWREWCEILLREDEVEFVSRQDELEPVLLARAAAVPGGPLIGYRRGPVRVQLRDGWSITIPGAMVERWEADESELWSAWDASRTVWFKSYLVVNRETGEPMPAAQMLRSMALPEDGERYEPPAGSLPGAAVFRQTKEKGEPIWNLCARSALDGCGALCNIFIKNPADLPWALETSHGLEHSRTQIR